MCVCVCVHVCVCVCVCVSVRACVSVSTRLINVSFYMFCFRQIKTNILFGTF